MSSTLRDATEHTVHSLTELVGDAMHHIDLPHVDLARVTGRKSSRSTILFVVLGAAVLAMGFIVIRRRRSSGAVDDIVATD